MKRDILNDRRANDLDEFIYKYKTGAQTQEKMYFDILLHSNFFNKSTDVSKFLKKDKVIYTVSCKFKRQKKTLEKGTTPIISIRNPSSMRTH